MHKVRILGKVIELQSSSVPRFKLGLTNDIKLDDTQLFFLFVSLLRGFLLCLWPH